MIIHLATSSPVGSSASGVSDTTMAAGPGKISSCIVASFDDDRGVANVSSNFLNADSSDSTT